MGVKNYLVEGVSCSGKTSVADELQRRGYQVVHGDRELAYQGDPETGEPTAGVRHTHHIWCVEALRSLAANRDHEMTFFCGGSRNISSFIDLFDKVFVLEVDLETLERRLDRRPADEFGARPWERALVLRVHRTREDIPKGAVSIDATRPVEDVVDEIVTRVRVA